MVTSEGLIALDWGSTRLRAFLLGGDGAVLAARQSEDGASALTGDAAFSKALAAVTQGWPELPLIACGMVGSQHGWHEAPYAPCPADSADIAQRAVKVNDRLWIIPGLQYDDGVQPDVMRGEETQIVGALAARPELAELSNLVLPGTHSKWARIRAGKVVSFATHMTGELYALLRRHSVLARLMPNDEAPGDSHVFEAGLHAASQGGALSHQLFAVRTLGLFERLPIEQLTDYLSGLLIGHEVAHELKSNPPGQIALIGEAALCGRYAAALRHFGADSVLQLNNTAPAGLWHLARNIAV